MKFLFLRSIKHCFVKKSGYIRSLIEDGEHAQQDFKFGITDSRKIAKSLSAFANTEGGRLLVGVKDNGAIAGVRSDEEFYMIDAAAKLYTRPEIPFRVVEWEEDGKTVLEVVIEKGNNITYKAIDERGKEVAYIRVDDKNFAANTVLLQVWERRRSLKGAYIELSEDEISVLHHIRNTESVSMNQLLKLTGLRYRKMTDILVNLILMDVLDMEFTEGGVRYKPLSKAL